MHVCKDENRQNGSILFRDTSTEGQTIKKSKDKVTVIVRIVIRVRV